MHLPGLSGHPKIAQTQPFNLNKVAVARLFVLNGFYARMREKLPPETAKTGFQVVNHRPSGFGSFLLSFAESRGIS